jgi:hypothetical protein
MLMRRLLDGIDNTLHRQRLLPVPLWPFEKAISFFKGRGPSQTEIWPPQFRLQ